MKVYAAGPMTGMTYEQASVWRWELDKLLKPCGIKLLSPTRSTSHRYATAEYPKVHSQNDGPMFTNRGVTRRDRFDVKSSDAVVFNVKGMKTAAMGTLIELGWATAYDKPTIMIMEPGGFHEHAMVNDLVDYRVHTVEAAAEIVKILFAVEN